MIDQHLRALLLQQRGDNHPLVAEVLEKLSPENKLRLYRLLDTLIQEKHYAERRARRFDGRCR